MPGQWIFSPGYRARRRREMVRKIAAHLGTGLIALGILGLVTLHWS